MIVQARLTHLVQTLREPRVPLHHRLDLLAHLPFHLHVAALGQPAQDVEAVRVDGRVAASALPALGPGQRERHVDDKDPQAPAVAERETDGFLEALEDLVVAGDRELDALDLAARALVQGVEGWERGG